jgi:hypothetical protein
VTLLFYMALTGSLYFLPFLMMQVHGYSALVAGSAFLPFVAISLVLGRYSGRIVARFGTKIPIVVASLAIAVGLVLFALPGANAGPYWISFLPAMVVQGFGMALHVTPLTTATLRSVERGRSGLASGVNNAAARVAGLLAVAVLGLLVYGAFSTNLDARLDRGTHDCRSGVPMHGYRSPAVRLASDASAEDSPGCRPRTREQTTVTAGPLVCPGRRNRPSTKEVHDAHRSHLRRPRRRVVRLPRDVPPLRRARGDPGVGRKRRRRPRRDHPEVERQSEAAPQRPARRTPSL